MLNDGLLQVQEKAYCGLAGRRAGGSRGQAGPGMESPVWPTCCCHLAGCWLGPRYCVITEDTSTEASASATTALTSGGLLWSSAVCVASVGLGCVSIRALHMLVSMFDCCAGQQWAQASDIEELSIMRPCRCRQAWTGA